MAQIIKHRRGSIGSLKDVTANVGELVMATGSIGDLNAPVLFIGESAVAGGYKPVSKIYQGAAVPVLGASYGSTMDGTPFYSNNNKTLYILDRNGNIDMDFTGNIEGNVISGVTINSLTSSFVSASNTVYAATGSFGQIQVSNIAFTGLTEGRLALVGPTGSIVDSGSLNFNDGELGISGSIKIDADAYIYHDGELIIEDNANGVTIQSNNYAELQSSNAWIWVEGGSAYVQGGSYTRISTDSGNVDIFSYDGGTLNLNTDGGEGDINMLNGSNKININGNVYITGSEYVNNIYSLTGSTNNGLHLGGGTFGAPDVELSSNTNISLFAEGGTPVINVTGSMKVTGDVTVEQNMYVSGNIYQTGSFYTQGDIVLSGSINIGDNIGVDTINFQGEVSSSILPKISDVFDLGGPSNYWHDLYVSGTAYVDVLKANSISLDGITVFNDLIVSGSSYLGLGGGDQVIVSGSIYNDALTEKRMVVVGAQGLLTDYSGLTFDNGNLNLSGALEVTNIQGTGSLYLQPDKNDVRLFEIYNTASNDVHIKGNATYSFFGDDTNYLVIDDSLDTVSITGVNGVFISSSLKVTGSVNINGNTAMTGSLIVSNASGVFESSLIVSNSDLTLDGGSDIHMNDAAHLYFDTCVDIYYDNGTQNLIFANSCNDFEFRNDVSITGSLNVSSGITTNDIYSIANSNNALHLNGGFSAPNVELESSGQISLFSEGGYGTSNYAINMTGSVHIMDSLDVTGSATFLSGVTFNNSVTLTGLTDNRVVIVGTGGILEDDSNFTFDGTTFKIGDGDFEVDVLSGDTRISGSLMVKNSATITGSFNLKDSATNFSIVGNGFSQTYFQGNGALVWNPGYGGMEVVGTDAHLKVNDYLNVGNGAGITGSLGVSGSLNVSGDASVTGAFTVSSGSMTSLGGDLYVSGNLQVLGSSTNVSLESHTVNIGDNIILVNAYSPFQRYAGIAAYDSGSSGVSGSLLWDSLSDYWMFVSSSNQTSKLVGTTTGAYGSETNLTSGTFPIADGANTIGDSLLTYSGTTLAFNTNKFTVDSSTGDTYISGNVTVDMGGDDNGSLSSWVTFRNDDNILGFVDSTDTLAETTQLLGYDAGDGTLKFSSLIDGGTY